MRLSKFWPVSIVHRFFLCFLLVLLLPSVVHTYNLCNDHWEYTQIFINMHTNIYIYVYFLYSYVCECIFKNEFLMSNTSAYKYWFYLSFIHSSTLSLTSALAHSSHAFLSPTRFLCSSKDQQQTILISLVIKSEEPINCPTLSHRRRMWVVLQQQHYICLCPNALLSPPHNNNNSVGLIWNECKTSSLFRTIVSDVCKQERVVVDSLCIYACIYVNVCV